MKKNTMLWQQSLEHIPGGVHSPVRAFNAVGGVPRFVQRGEGCRIYDEEGKVYVDYMGSWGPLIVGHAHPQVVQALCDQAQQGLSFGAPTAIELDFVQTLKQILPILEKVRLVSSGTEATMSAIRVARGFTGRDALVKCVGCYHGHSDSLLVQAGSGALTFGVPSSSGVPRDTAKNTYTLAYNDTEGFQELFAQHGKNIAAVIVEPIAGNMGMVMPDVGFLETVQTLCQRYDSLLIVDEVMTGFRVGLGGAVAHFGLKPDLITLGKVIGGGMPVAAFGGRAEVMDNLSPQGGVYQAGTLSGNPVALAAGLATLRLIRTEGFYAQLGEHAQQLTEGLCRAADQHGIAFLAQHLGGMFGMYFAKSLPRNMADMQKSNIEHFKIFFHRMLEAGHYFSPSAFEAGFISIAHTADDIEQTIGAAAHVFSGMAKD